MRHFFRSIVAATDLGGASDDILRAAAILAGRSGAELHLIHSLEMTRDSSQHNDTDEGSRAKVRRAAEQLRDQVRRVMPEGVVPATQRVVAHVAHKAILECAGEVSADLIVVGPHAGGAMGAHFLGTTAEHVIRGAEVPCLVVRKPLSPTVHRIGVPIDCSDPAQGALQVAFRWGEVLGAYGEPPEVWVMNVGWKVEQIDNPAIEQERLRPELQRQIDAAKKQVAGAEALRTHVEIVWAANPTEATIAWAKDRKLDLLVLGTRGRGGLKRAMIGSVASGMARQAPCAVLLVPPSLWSGEAAP
jgi:nucleotide-binding universal stress UspA family protein